MAPPMFWCDSDGPEPPLWRNPDPFEKSELFMSTPMTGVERGYSSGNFCLGCVMVGYRNMEN